MLFLQENGAWYAFWDSESHLIGFRDAKGNIKVKPRFVGLRTTTRFKNIIALTEFVDGRYAFYYLLKSGKQVGKDSLYVFDNTFDCEQEGFIRFRDEKTDKVGFFDVRGKVVIPADYNTVSRFHNGVAVAVKGAERQCWDDRDPDNCEHWGWKGGATDLIDTNNRVLIENFKNDSYLDWYSMKVEDSVSGDPERCSYRGINGRFYTFKDHKKYFENWLNVELLGKLNRENLIRNAQDSIYYSTKKHGMAAFCKNEDFITEKFDILKKKLLEIHTGKVDYFISLDRLNPFIFKDKEYAPYFDDCGEARNERFPVFSVVVNYRTPESETYLYQDHFAFLKTEKGYKLISVFLGDDKSD